MRALCLALAAAALGLARPARTRRPASAACLGSAALAGSALLWGVSAATLGLVARLGLPAGRAVPAAGADPALWLAVLAAGPVAEELLYRERVQTALRTLLPPSIAITAAAALYALPHVEPALVVGSFLLGLAIGSIYEHTGSVACCVAAHVGFNAAALSLGAPPPAGSSVAGVAVALVAVWLARAGRRQVRPG